MPSFFPKQLDLQFLLDDDDKRFVSDFFLRQGKSTFRNSFETLSPTIWQKNFAIIKNVSFKSQKHRDSLHVFLFLNVN